MNCPKCSGEEYIKSGFVNGRQRYKCKSCKFSYTVLLKRTAKILEQKRFALALYLEGLGFNELDDY